MTLERAVLERNRTVGLVALDEGTVLTATDLAIMDTLASLAQATYGLLGTGLWAFSSAQVTLERAVLERNAEIGLNITGEGAALTATDLLVSDTHSWLADGRAGAATFVWGGATASVERVRILDNQGYGLRVQGAGSTVRVADLAIERTMEQTCAVGLCTHMEAGFGLTSVSGATLEVRRFRSIDNAAVGVLVASGSELDLHEGIVSGNRIGANVQINDYDLGRLQDQVVYVGNDVNSDTTRFELSEAPETLNVVPPEHP
ncbi:MAG: hypothetical protein HYY06_07235 [Deltaproteobacteria bacterium]|nr:hypothetical protein [Deltaproteobacteria bacterium]